jgi:hypothetical protein
VKQDEDVTAPRTRGPVYGAEAPRRVLAQDGVANGLSVPAAFGSGWVPVEESLARSDT